HKTSFRPFSNKDAVLRNHNGGRPDDLRSRFLAGLYGPVRDESLLESGTAAGYGAFGARGFIGQAHDGPEIHERLVEIPRPPGGQDVGSHAPDSFGKLFRAGW